MPANEKEKLTRQKRLLLSCSEEVAFNRLVNRIADGLDTPVKGSHVLRACIAVLHHAEKQIVRKTRTTTLKQPPNEHTEAIVDFERRLAQLLLSAFKKAPRW